MAEGGGEPPQAIFPVTHSAARQGAALNKPPTAQGGVVVVEWNTGHCIFFLRSDLTSFSTVRCSVELRESVSDPARESNDNPLEMETP